MGMSPSSLHWLSLRAFGLGEEGRSGLVGIRSPGRTATGGWKSVLPFSNGF